MKNNNSTFIYRTEDLQPFIDYLAHEFRLVAPVEKENHTEFAFVENPSAVLLDDRRTYMSAKEFVFPRSEKLFVLKGDDARQVEPQEETVVFGMRPCDLSGLKVMNAVFSKGKYTDPFFEARMERTILIGLGCIEKKEGCFCDERGISRDYSEDCDIFISTGEKAGNNTFVIEAFSEKGRNIVNNAPGLFPADKSCYNEASSIEVKETVILPKTDEKHIFDLKIWESVSKTCIGCGTCTYICPTCHCFAFKDIKQGEEITRYRLWDSCMFPRFTMHASGHNPRNTRGERYRQRVLHKYMYVPANFELIACTGCGRCISSCPAGISIRDIVCAVARELEGVNE